MSKGDGCTDEILAELQAENEKLKDQLERVKTVVGKQAEQLWLVKKFWEQQARKVDEKFRSLNIPKNVWAFNAGRHRVLKALKPTIKQIKTRDINGRM